MKAAVRSWTSLRTALVVFSLKDFLILFLTKAILPGNPFEAGLLSFVYKAE